MSESLWRLRDAAAATARQWQRFFHEPCDARVCAAVRVAFAMLVLVHFAVLYPDLERWFTGQGVLPAAVSREIAKPQAWSLLWLGSDTLRTATIGFWLAVGHAALLLVGFWPRLNALGVFVWLVSFQTRNGLILDGEDTLFRVLAFLLIWLPSGRCWSLDAALEAWWRRRSGRPAPPGDCSAPGWGLRLWQVYMAVLLFSTGLAKLEGETWLDGTAVYYVSRLDDYFGRWTAPAWPFDTPWTVALMTWSVVLVELTVPVLIWFRETRLLCLVAVALFHLANEWTMNLFLFHWLMLCGWLAFIEPGDWRWLRLRHGAPDGA